MIATGVKPKPPKFFQVLEFIGHQETSSGCGLMGLGEKMLSLTQYSGNESLCNLQRFGVKNVTLGGDDHR